MFLNIFKNRYKIFGLLTSPNKKAIKYMYIYNNWKGLDNPTPYQPKFQQSTPDNLGIWCDQILAWEALRGKFYAQTAIILIDWFAASERRFIGHILLSFDLHKMFTQQWQTYHSFTAISNKINRPSWPWKFKILTHWEAKPVRECLWFQLCSLFNDDCSCKCHHKVLKIFKHHQASHG